MSSNLSNYVANNIESNYVGPNFTIEWEMADVAIKCRDSDKLLHVNKSVLATHSPVFKALFFGGFSEEKKDEISLEVDYKIFLEILKILHHAGKITKAAGTCVYSIKELTEFYRLAELYNIPLIMDLCKQQFTLCSPPGILEIAIELGFHKQKIGAIHHQIIKLSAGTSQRNGPR